MTDIDQRLAALLEREKEKSRSAKHRSESAAKEAAAKKELAAQQHGQWIAITRSIGAALLRVTPAAKELGFTLNAQYPAHGVGAAIIDASDGEGRRYRLTLNAYDSGLIHIVMNSRVWGDRLDLAHPDQEIYEGLLVTFLEQIAA